MLTITDNAVAVLRDDAPKLRVYIDYKRRYWDGDNQTYTWEASWQNVSFSDIMNPGKLTYQLDIRRAGDYKIPHITIELKNDYNQWKSDNDRGVFWKDSTAKRGYMAYKTKFRFRVGILLASGSEEIITVFQGVATDWRPNIRSKTIQVKVEGYERILKDANAENVSDSFNETKTSTGQTQFQTTATGVGRIYDTLTNAGTFERQGSDYTVSNLDQDGVTAQLDFAITVPNSNDIVYSGIKWKTDEKIEDLVELLLTEAGFSSLEYDVEPVLFQSQVNNVWTQETQTHWDAGTKTNVSSTDYADQVLLQDTPTVPANNDFETAGSGGSSDADNWSQSAGSTRVSTFPPASSPANGSWLMQQAYLGGGTVFLEVYLLDADSGVTLLSWTTMPSSPSAWTQFSLTGLASYKDRKVKVQVRGGQVAYPQTATSEAFYLSGNDQLDIRRIRYQGGAPLFIHYTGADYITGNVKRVFSATGNIVTQTLDMSASVVGLGQLYYETTVPSGTTVSFDTRTSTDGIVWDSWVPLGVTGHIESAVKRYIQVRCNMTTSNTGISPRLNKLQVFYTTTTTTINLANFKSWDCFKAVTELAKLPMYEMGFKGDGTFFFRPRSADVTIDLTLKNGQDIYTVDSYSEGIENVYNRVEVAFGSHSRVQDSALSGDSEPTSESTYGVRRLSISAGQSLLNPDADVASGVAETLYNLLKFPRKVVRMTCKLLPQVELSDTVSATFEDHNAVWPYKKWYWGDSQQNYQANATGQGIIHYISKASMTLKDFVGKVVGVEHDFKNMNTILTLEEVIENG